MRCQATFRTRHGSQEIANMQSLDWKFRVANRIAASLLNFDFSAISWPRLAGTKHGLPSPRHNYTVRSQ